MNTPTQPRSNTRHPFKYSVTVIGGTKSGSHVHVSKVNGDIISFANIDREEDFTSVEPIALSRGSEKIAKWGKDNQLPQRREKILIWVFVHFGNT